MTKVIAWTKRAISDLEKVTQFNIKQYGSVKALEVSKNLIKSLQILQNSELDFSELGQIDPSFNHLKKVYRKIINNHCKITYRVDKTKIYIVRVFDTRQHPNKNK